MPFAKLNVSDEPPEYFAKLDPQIGNALVSMIDTLLTYTDNKKNIQSDDDLLEIQTLQNTIDEYKNMIDQLNKDIKHKDNLNAAKIDDMNSQLLIAEQSKEHYKNLYLSTKEISNANERRLEELTISHNKKLAELKSAYEERLEKSIAERIAIVESNYRNHIDNINNNYKQQLKLQLDEQCEINNANLDSYKMLYDKEIALYKTIINNHKLELQNVKDDFIAKEAYYNKRLAEVDTMNHEQLSNKLDLLNTRITPLVKPYEGTNKQRGDNGEALVFEYLFATFKSAIIKDVSGNAHQGDIYFVLNNIKCLFEIKNEVKISLADIEKFKRDVAERSEQLAINCAVFVSLQSGRFPGKPNEELCIDVEKGIPVVYIYLLPNQLSILNYAIYYLQNLLSTKKIEEETSHALVTNVNSYHNIVCFMKDNLDKILSTIRKLDTLAVKGLSMAEKEEPVAKNNYLKYCSSFMLTNTSSLNTIENKEEKVSSTNEKDTDNTIEVKQEQSNTLMDYLPKDHNEAKVAIARMYCKLLFAGKWSFKNRRVIIKQDLYTPFGLTEEQFNTYGTLESIETLAKQTYLDDIFTENKVKAYKDLISDPTFKRPSGQALSKFYTSALSLDDSTLKKLRVILNNKSPVGQVVQYLNSRIAELEKKP